MPNYQYPICRAEVQRDIVIYFEHTDQHIIDAIKKRHPEWVEKDGLCPKCVEYIKQQLKK